MGFGVASFLNPSNGFEFLNNNFRRVLYGRTIHVQEIVLMEILVCGNYIRNVASGSFNDDTHELIFLVS